MIEVMFCGVWKDVGVYSEWEGYSRCGILVGCEGCGYWGGKIGNCRFC